MSLKVELKPGEKIIIGESSITNGPHRTRFFIEGDAPILRQKDIMSVEDAISPARNIYFAVQLMYLSKTPEKFHQKYFELINELIAAAPSTIPFVTNISNNILNNKPYKALKEAKKLIRYEEALISHVQSSDGNLPEDDPVDGEPAGTGGQPPAEGRKKASGG
ncbi:flagellar biosynthesis repressor FlbT [Rhodobium gokarnense]|uniref:Flagellar protein FlbT n=1 Tax=Rhodobium gokarnense TaxID=364296 RepID=A0ABT3HDE8_9HYPH|nr:flagellar biosynthesis repressor FlbT [Rhodobium gokarnense]MCW2308311.1 flagellar protein FlbT [Rhodobium gokarnense]